MCVQYIVCVGMCDRVVRELLLTSSRFFPLEFLLTPVLGCLNFSKHNMCHTELVFGPGRSGRKSEDMIGMNNAIAFKRGMQYNGPE